MTTHQEVARDAALEAVFAVLTELFTAELDALSLKEKVALTRKLAADWDAGDGEIDRRLVEMFHRELLENIEV